MVKMKTWMTVLLAMLLCVVVGFSGCRDEYTEQSDTLNLKQDLQEGTLDVEKNFSFQWMRSISPDLNISYKGTPQVGTLLHSSSTDGLFTLTSSALLKTNNQGDKQWVTDYWKNHDITSFGFLDGLQYYNAQLTPEGNIVAIGIANTNDIPVKNAFQDQVDPAIRKGLFPIGDGYIVCRNPQGDLLWGTFIGGSEVDVLQSLLIHSSGIYVLVGTGSPNFPTTNFHDQDPSESLFIVMKFSFEGELLWSKPYFLNVFSDKKHYDTGWGCNASLNATGMAILCVLTDSKKGYQDTNPDMGIVQLDFEGNVLWDTSFGGSNTETFGNWKGLSPCYAPPIFFTNDQHIFIIGKTFSTDFPLKNAFQSEIFEGSKPLDEWWGTPVINPNGCTYITCFDITGEMLWSTYFSGPMLLLTDACLVQDKLYLAGITEEQALQVSASPTGEPFHGNADGILVQFDSQGHLLWNSYFGGEKDDTVNAIQVKDNMIYCTGITDSSSIHLLPYRACLVYLAFIDPENGNTQVGLQPPPSPWENRSVFLSDPYHQSFEDIPDDDLPLSFNIRFCDLLVCGDTAYTVGSISIYIKGFRSSLFQEYEMVTEECGAVFFLSKWKQCAE